MNLLIDFGNSRIKIAFADATRLFHIRTWNSFSLQELRKLTDELEKAYPENGKAGYAILSDTGFVPNDLVTFLADNFRFIHLDYMTPLPVIIKYYTAETLGRDRIALAVAGNGLYPKQNVLVIDAGTCITYDYVTNAGEYLGGGISPGIRMRFRALNNFTDKLPLIEEFQETDLIGSSTRDSMISGVLNGIVAEVDNIIERYKRENGVERVVLTGGDLIYFDGRLKNDIFANSNLVLEGLNMILNYNVGK